VVWGTVVVVGVDVVEEPDTEFDAAAVVVVLVDDVDDVDDVDAQFFHPRCPFVDVQLVLDELPMTAYATPEIDATSATTVIIATLTRLRPEPSGRRRRPKTNSSRLRTGAYRTARETR
jgi:hypothetical protein